MVGFRVLAALALALASLASTTARAVPSGQVSWTAEAVCDFRAIGAQHADPGLRNRDTLAAKLCRPVFLPHDYDAARAVIDDNPEAYAGFFYVNARTRHIDDALERAAAAGATQVVILGSGFDSRPYRFAKAYPALSFFEVDLPATVAAKTAAVKRLFGDVPAQVHLAPIDFDHQSLVDVLAAAGYDPARKTFFILEGVTMYLTPAGNEATFGFIQHHAAAGSRLVFDYLLRQVVDGDFSGLYAVRAEARGVAQAGEPFLSGWTPAEAARFVEQHGLRVLDDLGPAELTRRYLVGSDGRVDGRPPDGYRLMDAELR